MRGLFMVDRSVLDHHIVGSSNDRIAMWLWMLSAAAWKDRKVFVCGKEIHLGRGQLLVSIRTISAEMRVSKGVAERFIRDLKTGSLIETRSETGGTVITICNYEKYQRFDKYGGTAVGTPNETTAGQQQDGDGTATGHKRTKGTKGTTDETPDNSSGNDLFPDELPKQIETDPEAELIEAGWEDFKTIWPAGHSRKQTGKTARAKYEAACRGKNAKASGPVAPLALNRAARAYIKSVRDPQFIKGTEAWLNGAMWEPFLAAERLPERQRQSSDQRIIARYSGLNTSMPDNYADQLPGVIQ